MRATKGRATDPQAHRLYLLARHLLERFGCDDAAKAIEYLSPLAPCYRIGGGQITPVRSYLDQGGTTPLVRAYAIDCPRCSC